jgi:type I restriction enzyme R subunit
MWGAALHDRATGVHRPLTATAMWLDAIVDHLAANLEIAADDFEYPPFAQRGGLGAAYRVFGKELTSVLDEVTGVVAA